MPLRTTDPAATHSPLADWHAATQTQRELARDVARLIADTLSAMFPGAAYLTMMIDEDADRDWELGLDTVRDGSGAPLLVFDDDSDLPELGPEHEELGRRWGSLNHRSPLDLLGVLRDLYNAGAVFDRLPLDLDLDDYFGDDDEVVCMLLSPEGRPYEWELPDPDNWNVGSRRLRPYRAALQSSGRPAEED
ncbi:hypothetical protein ACIQF6_35780 [Kitasatospora sp. NPDC092948]|uniref:hypothetical protein n=1 Tax=Kitasatospora sp. NPDC092948 TaxID=3364088 RepID=UPI003822FE59